MRKSEFPKCKTCDHLSNSEFCKNKHICESGFDPCDNESLIYSYCEGGGFIPDDNFGCIHHSEIEVKE